MKQNEKQSDIPVQQQTEKKNLTPKHLFPKINYHLPIPLVGLFQRQLQH